MKPPARMTRAAAAWAGLALAWIAPALAEPLVRFSGSWRVRYEVFDQPSWGQGAADSDGHWLQRFMGRMASPATGPLRTVVEWKSAHVSGRAEGPRATDEDALDWHQAYVELAPAGTDPAGARRESGVRLRVGRQELAFGSSRLISVRDGPNVRLSFDGVRLAWQADETQVDLFAVAPVETRAGRFDDGREVGRRLWGAYAVTPAPFGRGGLLDAYYLGFRREEARFNQGTARELRHTVGVRWWGEQAGWDHNVEAAVQAGRFGDAPIRAWTVAGDAGHTWRDRPWRPRVGVKANLSSGDRDPRQRALQTFNALFPRGAYFGESGLLGPGNLVDVHPSVTLQPAPRVAVTLEANWFWRQSGGDGLYNPAVAPVRPDVTAATREVGRQTALTVAWRPTSRWSVTTVVSHFDAGDFLAASGPGADTLYATSWVTFTF